MIEEPPLLQIQRPRRRPTEAQIAAIAAQPTGFLCDAMDGRGALDPSLTLLDPVALPDRFCGVALTAEPGPDDILALIAALRLVQPGDVLISATGAWRHSAAAGDRVIGMARNGGAVAFVTDGMVRDHEGIVEVGLPVVCAGMTPNSPYGKGPGKVGHPVVLGGMAIATGDLIVGDRSGTVVVPFERIDDVIATVERVSGLEAELDGKVANGQTVPESMVDLLKTDQVAWT
ncbi:MAG: RraA family protein [Pseudomonadota bacterium]